MRRSCGSLSPVEAQQVLVLVDAVEVSSYRQESWIGMGGALQKLRWCGRGISISMGLRTRTSSLSASSRPAAPRGPYLLLGRDYNGSPDLGSRPPRSAVDDAFRSRLSSPYPAPRAPGAMEANVHGADQAGRIEQVGPHATMRQDRKGVKNVSEAMHMVPPRHSRGGHEQEPHLPGSTLEQPGSAGPTSWNRLQGVLFPLLA